MVKYFGPARRISKWELRKIRDQRWTYRGRLAAALDEAAVWRGQLQALIRATPLLLQIAAAFPQAPGINELGYRKLNCRLIHGEAVRSARHYRRHASWRPKLP